MKVEIRKIVESKKAILGKDRTLKALHSKTLKTVFLAKNFPEELKEDFERYSKISGFKLVTTEFSNEELGVICRKPFFVSVIGVLK
jgi:large subunit ribosomal protein L30e